MTSTADTNIRSPPGRLVGLVPALTWLARYDRAWLPKDLVGGLAAGSVVIPQAMAYATIADLPVEVGLYTCMVPMVVYALVGGSRTLSVSTTSTVAVLTGSTLLAADVAADADDPARRLATLTVLVGLILVAARLLRLGSVIDNISAATLTGVKIGVGLTVAAGQAPKLLGIDGDPDASTFFAEVGGIVDDLGEISWTTIAFSAATLAVLLGVRRALPSVPGPLVAVALGILAVVLFELDEHGLALVAPVPSGLPTPVVPSLDHVGDLAGGAFAIAVMCFLETASVAGAVRRRDEPAIDNDQELFANGVVCVAGGLFRAMPSAGGFSQTAVNQGAGARTQLSGVVTASLAVASALFLGGVLSELPQATLGCLVIVAAVGLVSLAELRRYWRLDRLELWVALATAACGLLVGLLVAVLVGVLLTLFLVLRELDRLAITELHPTVGGDDLVPATDGSHGVPGLLVLRFDGPLYTANVRSALRRVRAAVDGADPRILVLDLTAVPRLPVMVLDQLVELSTDLAAQQVEVWIAGMSTGATAAVAPTEPYRAAVAAGRVFPTALAAVRNARAIDETRDREP